MRPQGCCAIPPTGPCRVSSGFVAVGAASRAPPDSVVGVVVAMPVGPLSKERLCGSVLRAAPPWQAGVRGVERSCSAPRALRARVRSCAVLASCVQRVFASRLCSASLEVWTVAQWAFCRFVRLLLQRDPCVGRSSPPGVRGVVPWGVWLHFRRPRRLRGRLPSSTTAPLGLSARCRCRAGEACRVQCAACRRALGLSL